MSPEAAIKFLKALGAKEAKYDGGNWVKAPCVLAPWTHKGGRDTNPSFGIKVNDMTPHYNCFSCRSGQLFTLIQEVEMFLSKDASQKGHYDTMLARTILENDGFDIEPLPEFSEFGGSGQEFQEWPDYFIDSFANWEYSARAANYLKQRNVSTETAKAHGLKYDSKKDMIVFPYRNLYGKLAGARGRAIELHGEPPKKARHYDYTWNQVNNANLVWYNEEAIAEEQPLVIVEGQFDKMRVSEVYPHVVANLTAKPIAAKMKKLAYAPSFILFADNDDTADTAIQKYLEWFDHMDKPVAVVQPPKNYTEDGKLIKLDPDLMGSAWIKSKLQELEVL